MMRKKLVVLLFALLLVTACGSNASLGEVGVDLGSAQPAAVTQLAETVTQATEALTAEIVQPSDTFLTYVVQSGDSLAKIAAGYGVTVEQLVALNTDRYPSLATNPSLIRVGWELRLPGGTAPQMAEVSAQVEEPASQPPTAAAVKVTKVFDVAEAETYLLSGVNQARTEAGLSPLTVDPALVEIARERSQDMIARNYFSHQDPETGEIVAKTLFDQRGYTQYTAAENIAIFKNGAGDVPASQTIVARYDSSEVAEQFVKGWLQSLSHRENIFHAGFTKTGLGVAVSADGKVVVVTQIFLE